MAEQAIISQLEEAEHPGEYLREALESQEITQTEFARRSGISRSHVSKVVSGKIAMTAELAIAAERILGGSARLWLNLDTAHRLWVARQEQEHQEESLIAWATGFPLLDLRERGYLTQAPVNETTVSEILTFFGVAGRQQWDEMYKFLVPPGHESETSEVTKKSQAAYLRICEIRANVWDLPPYNRDRLQEAVQTVRQNVHLDLPDMVTLATDALKQAGVALVLEPATDKSWLRGATFWPRRNKAVLALATGTETADRLRFSLFHQIDHIMLHRDHHFLDTSTETGPVQTK